jgi:hypothetical protein
MGEKFNFGIDEEGKDITQDVYRFVDEVLRSGLGVRSVVVTGSRAGGDYRPWSDLDLVLVAEGLPPGHRQRSLLLRSLYLGPSCGGMDVRPYTPDEFLESIWDIDVAAWDSLYYGKVLYDDGFWRLAKREFKRLRAEWRLRKLKYGWRAYRS